MQDNIITCSGNILNYLVKTVIETTSFCDQNGYDLSKTISLFNKDSLILNDFIFAYYDLYKKEKEQRRVSELDSVTGESLFDYTEEEED